MSKIHVNIPDDLRVRVRELADEYGYSIQDLTERALHEFVQREFNFSNGNGKAVSSHDFTFIDLFAGIGGLRQAVDASNGMCVFSSEIDRWCQRTYFANFDEWPHGDITSIPPETIPDHDLLTAGFPCQPFSIAGVSKKKSLGRAHGFKDEAQGTLFFNIAQILEVKNPKAFILENVKNLRSHDGGNTFRIIMGTLKELGYIVFSSVIDAQGYVPQHRERLFIVGFAREAYGSDVKFEFPKPPKRQPKLGSILDKKYDAKYVLSDKLWNYLQMYAKKHRAKGNGFGFGLCGTSDVARTLSARYYKDGSEILVRRGRGNPRRLTPRECARLMGYPDSFKIPVSDTQAYKQFGNSVVLPLAKDVAGRVVRVLLSSDQF